MPTPLHLLLVEDSERDARLLVRVLQQGGYDVAVERVESATAMAAALDAATWDLVIADFSAPSFSAPAALRLVTARGLDLPFIIVSGTMSQEVAVQMMRAGARDFLTKSDLVRLVPVIDRELREAAERRARHAAEEVLRSSEESFRLLFAQNPQPMWVFDRHSGQVLEVNEAALAYLGYSREAFLKLRLTDLVPSAAATQLLEYVRQPRVGLGHAGTWPHRTRTGRIIDVEIAAHTLHFAGHAAALIVTTDVSARKKPQIPRALTAKEREVLALLVQDVTSNRTLAARLGVSENTVKYHLRNILSKLHLQNRAQLVAYALRHGIGGSHEAS